MQSNSPRLWVVATPIGNPGDLSPRARKVLEEADLILAEDTRRAEGLFRTLGLKPGKMLSFFEHNEERRQQEAIAALLDGASVALVTDAGTPLLADPGYRLVRACRQKNIPVSPVPGPCAPIAALSASGLPPLPFTFLGFLPKTTEAQKTLFSRYADIPGSLIFFERKNRLCKSLKMAYICLGKREAAICRELTKEHEEFISGVLPDICEMAENLLGEITVIIGPAEKPERTPEKEVVLLADSAIDEGLKPRVAAKLISEKCSGWTADEIYDLLTNIKKRDEGM